MNNIRYLHGKIKGSSYTVAFRYSDSGVEFGIARCRKSDTNIKKLGNAIAGGRLNKKPTKLSGIVSVPKLRLCAEDMIGEMIQSATFAD